MWFKNGLKAQKLLAQGNALGIMPLQGALLTAFIPRALPWAKSFCPFRAFNHTGRNILLRKRGSTYFANVSTTSLGATIYILILS